MPRVSPDYVPAYRLHKSSGQAIVTLSSSDHLLGPFGSPESKTKYYRLVAEWIEGGRKPLGISPPQNDAVVPTATVKDLVDAFTAHVDGTYRMNGASHIKRCIRFASEYFGRVKVDDFRPTMAIKCREQMIASGWTRNGCNRGLMIIRMMFKFGVVHEIAQPATLQRLQAIEPLKVGRTHAPESAPVKPVADTDIAAIQPFVAPPIWSIIQLQRLCGARGGELLELTAKDINTSSNIWTYRPAKHKTAHRGHDRIIYFGPKAQAVLRPVMEGRAADAYLFSPRDGFAARMASKGTQRRRPNQKPTPRATARKIGDHYTPSSYRRAISYGCKRAKITTWHPHQLRHSAATEWRRGYGPDAALTLLGDRTSNLIEVYAERDHQTAMRIAAEIG